MVTLGDWKYCTPASVLKTAVYVCGVFRPNNTWSGISTRVCCMDVTEAAGVKPKHLFKICYCQKHEPFCSLNRRRQIERGAEITCGWPTLKVESDADAASRCWHPALIPSPKPTRPPPPRQHHNILVGWLVGGVLEYHFWYEEGQTSIEMLRFWESKNRVWKAKRPFGWNNERTSGINIYSHALSYRSPGDFIWI